jgi:hypothetical protein
MIEFSGGSSLGNWTISDCAFIGLGSGSVAGLHFAGALGAVVRNNYFSGWDHAYGALDFSTCLQCVADGNTLLNTNQGIYMSGTGYGGVIVNNYIYNPGGDGIVGDYPWYTTVANNVINHPGNAGIRIYGSHSSLGQLTITGNSIYNYQSYCLDINSGPGAEGSVKYSTITGNSCHTTAGAGGSIKMWTGEDYNTISGNQTDLANVTAGQHTTIDSGVNAINPQTTTYQATTADFVSSKIITVASGTFTITMVASTSQPMNGQCIDVWNYGSGVVTLARSGQNLNGGTASLTIAAGSATAPLSRKVCSNGTDYFLR